MPSLVLLPALSAGDRGCGLDRSRNAALKLGMANATARLEPMATLWLDFKQNTKPVKRWSLSTLGILRPQTAHPSASPFDPSGHPAVNERSDTRPTLKSPLHQKGSFYTFYIYEGCFFFRRRLPCDKSYSLCYIDLSSACDRLRLSWNRKVLVDAPRLMRLFDPWIFPIFRQRKTVTGYVFSLPFLW